MACGLYFARDLFELLSMDFCWLVGTYFEVNSFPLTLTGRWIQTRITLLGWEEQPIIASNTSTLWDICRNSDQADLYNRNADGPTYSISKSLFVRGKCRKPGE